MTFTMTLERLQAFAARCLVSLIAREEDPDMRALYRRYLEELRE